MIQLPPPPAFSPSPSRCVSCRTHRRFGFVYLFLYTPHLFCSALSFPPAMANRQLVITAPFPQLYPPILASSQYVSVFSPIPHPHPRATRDCRVSRSCDFHLPNNSRDCSRSWCIRYELVRLLAMLALVSFDVCVCVCLCGPSDSSVMHRARFVLFCFFLCVV